MPRKAAADDLHDDGSELDELVSRNTPPRIC